MFNFFRVREELRLALKIMNKEVRLSANSYTHKIQSIEDRLTIMEKSMRELNINLGLIFEKTISTRRGRNQRESERLRISKVIKN